MSQLPEPWEVAASQLLSYAGNVDRQLKNSIQSATEGILRQKFGTITPKIVETMLMVAAICIEDEEYTEQIKQDFKDHKNNR